MVFYSYLCTDFRIIGYGLLTTDICIFINALIVDVCELCELICKKIIRYIYAKTNY